LFLLMFKYAVIETCFYTCVHIIVLMHPL